MMKLAVLNLCKPDAGLAHFGSIAELIIQWLSPNLPEARLIELDIASGTALPAAEDFDGYILSGSEKGVYDEAPWMQPLRALLLELRDAGIPVFGICFGHQIMADTYGGKAEKADYGFVVGPRQFTTNNTDYAARVMHQDQVTLAPPQASITASAPYCPIAALDYDFPARSVQFHPEYPNSFVAEAVELFEGRLLTEPEAATARASINQFTVADDLYSREIADFFREQLI